MQLPENYKGPLEFKLPLGYLDVTSITDDHRIGLPSQEHPYYVLRSKILRILDLYQILGSQYLVDAIMEVL